MARRAGAETLTHDVYRQLRADIVAARIGPGERLRPAELRIRFGVSLGVVREALARLAARGLVHVSPNRGFHVTQLSMAALTNLVETRKINESHALRLAIVRGDVAWESEAVAAHHRLERTPVHTEDDPEHRTDEWAAAHAQFHATLRAACGNDVLLDICSRLSDAGELYRGWSAVHTGGDNRDFAAEHRQLLQAVLARDADRAARLSASHIQTTADILLSADIGARGAAPQVTSSTEPD